jgi:hypothetical protein
MESDFISEYGSGSRCIVQVLELFFDNTKCRYYADVV